MSLARYYQSWWKQEPHHRIHFSVASRTSLCRKLELPCSISSRTAGTRFQLLMVIVKRMWNKNISILTYLEHFWSDWFDNLPCIYVKHFVVPETLLFDQLKFWKYIFLTQYLVLIRQNFGCERKWFPRSLLFQYSGNLTQFIYEMQCYPIFNKYRPTDIYARFISHTLFGFIGTIHSSLENNIAETIWKIDDQMSQVEGINCRIQLSLTL